MPAKRFPLTKRFNAALSEKAYSMLRDFSEKYSYGNNYILTLILENSEKVIDEKALKEVIKIFENEYGSPKSK